jgi:uroporphyrinogen decarboxylase
VAQLENGADAVQFFDTWAGLLSPEDYDRWAFPYARRVAEIVDAAGGRSIYYLNDGAALLEKQASVGSTAVSVDWRTDLAEVRERVPEEIVIQGNLDPLVLLGDPRFVAQRTREMLEKMRGRPGHVVNLGHGVIPQTPIESVAAFVETVQGWN